MLFLLADEEQPPPPPPAAVVPTCKSERWGVRFFLEMFGLCYYTVYPYNGHTLAISSTEENGSSQSGPAAPLLGGTPPPAGTQTVN